MEQFQPGSRIAIAIAALLSSPAYACSQVEFSQLAKSSGVAGSSFVQCEQVDATSYHHVSFAGPSGIRVAQIDADARIHMQGYAFGQDLHEHALADFDKDGDMDVFALRLTDPGGGRLFLWERSLYVDQTQSRVPALPRGISRILAEDIDKDGDKDLLVHHASGVTLLENDGAAKFRDVSARIVQTAMSAPIVLAVQDVDLDGRVDMIANQATTLAVWYQDGTGKFGARSTTLSLGVPPASVAVGDIDGDRDVDIFVAVYLGVDRLFEAAGGTWTEVPARLPSPSRGLSKNARFADIDEDADLDLVIAKSGFATTSDRLRVYRNDGRGFFADATDACINAGTSATSQDVIVRDLDHDGDVDIAYFAGSSARAPWVMERNLTRQADAPFSARIGTTMQLDLYAKGGFAPAGQFSIPLVSGASNRRALPVLGFGSLLLDPTTLVVLPAVAHPQASGRASLQLAVPNAGSLVQQTAWFQALVLHNVNRPQTWRLSNASSTTFVR